ncbi:MAG TPA: hypothetical protein VF714_06840, partial [Jatrophihabitans sp.]
MPALKFADPEHWKAIERQLGQVGVERFAFAYTRTVSNAAAGPVLEVVGILLVDELDTTRGIDGWSVSDQVVDQVHNHALATGYGIVEFHNHRHGPPGFSHTDEDALAPTVRYCLDLLGGTPYAAAVWADGAVHAEWWRPDADGGIERGQFSTVTVLGDQLRVLNAKPVFEERPARQLPLLGSRGQAAIATLRVALVGVGGVERGQFSTVTVLGDQLRVLNATPVTEERLARQLPLLGTRAQAAITTMRIAVVGAGGTGSHMAQSL